MGVLRVGLCHFIWNQVFQTNTNNLHKVIVYIGGINNGHVEQGIKMSQLQSVWKDTAEGHSVWATDFEGDFTPWLWLD